jgi:hypothetical protein
MSFGFGAADFKGTVKLCNWMQENCFDKDGTAGRQRQTLESWININELR